MKQVNNDYLVGYSDGLEIVAEKLKRLAYGQNTSEEILDTLNGVIQAVYKGRAEIQEMKQQQANETQGELVLHIIEVLGGKLV